MTSAFWFAEMVSMVRREYGGYVACRVIRGGEGGLAHLGWRRALRALRLSLRLRLRLREVHVERRRRPNAALALLSVGVQGDLLQLPGHSQHQLCRPPKRQC